MVKNSYSKSAGRTRQKEPFKTGTTSSDDPMSMTADHSKATNLRGLKMKEIPTIRQPLAVQVAEQSKKNPQEPGVSSA